MGILSSLFGRDKDASTAEPQSSEAVVTNDEQHNHVYERGSQLISPHMRLLGRDPKVTKKARDLDAVTAYNPQNWAAYWIKGKGYHVLGDQKGANSEFRASFDIQKENPDVAREYAASCLELGLGTEAIRATRYAIRLTPEDAGLHANLAVALLIDGKHHEAETAIEKALKMSPDDKISKAVRKFVMEVIAGKRKQPRTMADLMR